MGGIRGGVPSKSETITVNVMSWSHAICRSIFLYSLWKGKEAADGRPKGFEAADGDIRPRAFAVAAAAAAAAADAWGEGPKCAGGGTAGLGAPGLGGASGEECLWTAKADIDDDDDGGGGARRAAAAAIAAACDPP